VRWPLLCGHWTNRQLQSTDIEAYSFFVKSYGDIRKKTNYLYMPDRHYALTGGRIVQRVPQISGLSLTAEFAFQDGTQDSMSAVVPNFDLRAWGGFGYAKKSFQVRFNPYVTAGFWALSGQDPNSRTVGNFEPTFERTFNTTLSGDAPSWSEFYAYASTAEEGTYFWTNLKMAQLEAGFTPWKRFTFVGGYAHMDSMQPFAVNPYHAVGSVNPALPAAGLFGTGVQRGELAKGRMVYRLTPAVQGYIDLEKFFPGDFYIPQSNGYWFRMEINYKFNGFVAFHKS
jgi:hypothetical protein